jgi:hypothetical protein
VGKISCDNTNVDWGLGTNVPSKDIEIKSNNIDFTINADSDANKCQAGNYSKL